MDYCTFYTDGSGNYDWYPPNGHSPHKFHTLAGIILDPESDLKAKTSVDSILDHYIPKETRDMFPANKYELHFDEIKSGRSIYRKIDTSVRNEIIYKTFELILDLKPIAIASTVNKELEWNQWKQKSFPPQPYAMQSVIHKFSMHLNRRNRIGSVVYDEDKIQFNKLLQEQFLNFRRYGIEIRGFSYQPRTDRLPNILNNVNFCPSHLSAGIQLSDFIASAIWRNYERNDSEFYKMIDPLWEFDENAGKTYRDHVIT